MAIRNRARRSLSARRLNVSLRKHPRPQPAPTTSTTAPRSIAPSTTTPDHAALARAAVEVRAALEEAAFATAVAAARAGSIVEALASLSGADGGPLPLPSPTTPCPDGPLSPREREVLALVAEGRSNKDIAAALYVSPNTVKTHVTSLLHKLQADTRAQLAAIATRYELRPHATVDNAAFDPCAIASSRPRR